MDTWTDAVDTKAAIVLDQIGAACKLVHENKGDLSGVPQLYLDLLRSLYAEDYTFAKLADSSDLLVRYAGPAVDKGDPKVTLVTWAFSHLQKQVQNIAQSVVGLVSPEIKWPPELSPQLTGITPGSFIAGIRIPNLSEMTNEQLKSSKISDQLYASIQDAIQWLSSVPRYVNEEGIDGSIADEIPDPAIRNILVSAASELAPTGKMGIEEIFLYGQKASKSPPKALTPVSRKVLRQHLHSPSEKSHRSLDRPIRFTLPTPQIPADTIQERIIKEGSFQGVVRSIDLDDHRFELRQVKDIGTIQCRYSQELDHQASKMLDATVLVKGKYEEDESQHPRLMDVTTVKILKALE